MQDFADVRALLKLGDGPCQIPCDIGVWAFTLCVTGYLANRLCVEDWLQQDPELPHHPVVKPMFVFGLSRAGTTLTINVLKEDPAQRNFLRWNAFDSVPPPKP